MNIVADVHKLLTYLSWDSFDTYTVEVNKHRRPLRLRQQSPSVSRETRVFLFGSQVREQGFYYALSIAQ